MRRREPLTDDRLQAIVAKEIASSQQYDKSEMADLRRRALEYVSGEMTDYPAEKGRSSVVDMTTLDTLSWVLPSIIRMFTASGTMAICEPVEKSDDRWAEQATTGINHAFWKENEGYNILHDTTFNSLLHGNGVVKHWWDDRPKVKISYHSGLTEEAFADLITPQDTGKHEDGTAKETIEVLADELCEYELEEGDDGYRMPPPTLGGMPAEGGDATGGLNATPQPAMPAPAPPQVPMGPPPVQKALLHDCKIKRTTRHGKVGLMTIAPEDFLISSDATNIRDARLTGHKQQKTRSDLIEMGFAEEKVYPLEATPGDDESKSTRDDQYDGGQPLDNTEMEEVTLYELYLRIDVDGDGIAETVQIFYAGYGGNGKMLEWEVWEDEPCFSDVPCYPVPHRWLANGLFTRTRDVQEIKTVLLRQALDNMYGSNNPQRVAFGRVINPDELANPSFGGTVFMETGGRLEGLELPFFAEKALQGIEYFDGVIENRTGVSRMTKALDPEALQNQTATAAQLGHDSAYTQIELIGRNQSEMGWKYVFRAVLKLMVRHQRRKCTIRLTAKKWAEIDPRHWNADMDVTINTGLGTGSRDRDIAVLSAMKADMVAFAGLLKEAQMPGRALEMIPMIANALRKSAEAAGMRSPDEFIPEITDEDVQAAAGVIQKKNQQPPMEIQLEEAKAKTTMQVRQAELAAEGQAAQQKTQLDAVTERMKSRAQVDREQAQLEADMMTKDKDRENALIIEDKKQEMEREKLAEASRQKDLDRQQQWNLEMVKIQAQQQAQSEKIKADGENAKHQTKAKQNELLIANGKDPVSDGVAPDAIVSHMQQLVEAFSKAATAPKRVVRDPKTGRAVGVETVQ